MRQQELQDEEERMHKRLEVSTSNVNVAVADVEYSSNAGSLSSQFWILSVCVYVTNPSHISYSFVSIFVVAASSMSVVEHDEIVSSQDSCATSMVRPPAAARTNRYAILHCFSPQISQNLLMSLSVSVPNVFSPTYGYSTC